MKIVSLFPPLLHTPAPCICATFAVTIPFCGCDAPHICPTYMRTVFPFILVSSLYHYYYLPCSGTSTLTNQNLPNRQQNTEPNHGPGSLPTTATTAPAAAAAYSAYTTLFPDDSPTKYICGCVFTSVRGDAAEDAICVGSARVQV